MGKPNCCRAMNCETEVCGNKLHCPVHFPIYYPLYRQYKLITRKVQKYLDEPDLLRDLPLAERRVVATQFHNAAHLRRQYQQMAFRPEFRDAGHLSIIDKMIEQSAAILKALEEETDACTDNQFAAISSPETDSLAETVEDDKEILEVSDNDSGLDSPTESSVSDEEELERDFQYYGNQASKALTSTINRLYCVKEYYERVLGDEVNPHGLEMNCLGNSHIIAKTLDSILVGARRYESRPIITPRVVMDWRRFRTKASVCSCGGKRKDLGQCPADYFFKIAVAIFRNQIPDPGKIILNVDPKQPPVDGIAPTLRVAMVVKIVSALVLATRQHGVNFVCAFGLARDYYDGKHRPFTIRDLEVEIRAS